MQTPRWSGVFTLLFREDGDTLPDALRKVARHIGKTPEQLNDWRKRVHQNKQRPEAQRLYDDALEKARASGHTPGVAASLAVELLKDKNPK